MKTKKIIFIAFFLWSSFLLAQQDKPATTVQVTKAELLSFNDIKPLLGLTEPVKNYIVRHFILSGSSTENTDKGTVSVSFSELVDGGTFTEKQRALIEKYGQKGMVFTIGEISLMETGKPGTAYDPSQEVYFTVPDILVVIKD